MFKFLICAAAIALLPCSISAQTPSYQDRTALERDRDAMMGLKLGLSFGDQTPEMKLQFGTHYKLEGQYEFVPALSFVSQGRLTDLRLAGLSVDAEEDSGGGNNTALWLIGGGVVLAVAAASSGGGSDEPFCPTGGLALLDLLECIDED